MPKKSGLFGFIALAIKEGTINDLPMCPGCVLDSETNYYLLFNKNLAEEPNPFASLGYYLATKASSRAHLRIDSTYFTAESYYKHRRNLTYCHATEYFLKDTKKITVHYYFDAWGRYTHSRVTDEQGQLINISLEQEFILQQRAKVYGQAVQWLITKKQEKYFALTQQLDDGYEKITSRFREAGYNKEQLFEEIKTQIELNSIRDSLSDNGDDPRLNLFLSVLEELAATNLVTEGTTLQEEEEEEEFKPADKFVVSVNHKKSPVNKKHWVEQEIIQVRDAIIALELASKTINQQSTKEQLTNYLSALMKARIDLTVLSFRARSQQENINILFKRFDNLKQESILFTNAINQQNITQLEILLPYCRHSITYNFCHDLLNTWICESKADKLKAATLEQIFDLIQNHCEIFAHFIRYRGIVLTVPNGEHEYGYSLLALAFLSKRKETFSALLRYGASPHMPWSVDKKGQLTAAMEMLLRSRNNESFYVDELVRYGAEIQSDEEVYSLEQVKSIMAQARPVARRAINRELKELLAGVEAMGISNSRALADKLHAKQVLISCPLINFTYQHHEPQSVLYLAFAKYSRLSSLLLSLAFFSSLQGVGITVMPNSKCGGLNFGPEPVPNYDEIFGIDDPSNPSNLFIYYGVNNRSELGEEYTTRLTIITESINTRFKVPLDKAEARRAVTEIKQQAAVLETNKCFALAASCYIALNLIYSLCGPLSPEETEMCVKNWYNTAELFLKDIEFTKQLMQIELRSMLAANQSTSQLLQAMKERSQSFHANACAYYNNVLQMAYCSPYSKIKDLPIVDECHQKLTSIIAGGKLSASSEHFFKNNTRSRQEWQQIIARLKPWLAISERPRATGNLHTTI